MFLKSIHKTINGQRNKRMDKYINALLKFIRDKTFEKFFKLAENKHSRKDDIIVCSHKVVVDEL